MKRQLFAFASGLAAATACADHSQPNIVWIFSDDHSYQAIGAYKSRLAKLNPTPNIDKIATEGMIFKRAYVANSLCAPSRATLLTGKHNWKNGVATNAGIRFDYSQEIFPPLLQKAGYQTALIGKIHLAGTPRGFDYWNILPGQGHYINPAFISKDGRRKYTGYVSEIITDIALDWLENKRDPEKPFMLMVHHKAPHRPWIPAKKYMEKYKDVDIPLPDNFFDDYATRTKAVHDQKMEVGRNLWMKYDLKVTGDPSFQGGQYADRNKYYAEHKEKMTPKELAVWKYQIYMRDYLRCVASVDDSVGKILEYLDRSGLAKNTVVFYSSDQGFFNGEHGWFDKRFMYEEAFRTPLLVKWPGVVKPGSVNEDLVQNIDFAETFLDIAGAPVPKDMDGRSIVPLLKGEKPSDWRKALYYHYYEYPACHRVARHEGVFNGRYKLIRFYGSQLPEGEQWEFYDLERDPHEMRNVYASPEMKGKIGEMKKVMETLKKQYGAPKNDSFIKPPRKKKQ